MSSTAAYLALAPKSNAAHTAFGAAMRAAAGDVLGPDGVLTGPPTMAAVMPGNGLPIEPGRISIAG